MPKRGLSQETLKIIACVTMLLDHIGATFCPGIGLRIVGRIAFPIYCFMLVEGAHHTASLKKYRVRLLVGALLAEIPFDLAFSHRSAVLFDWSSNSVMLTLMLGFCMIEAMKRLSGFPQMAVILPFYLLAEWMHTDYGGLGILIIAVFALTRGLPREKLYQVIALCLVVYPGARAIIGSVAVNLEWFAVLALIPIFCYDGRKLTRNRAVQWGFYLFYPVHIALLALLEMIFFK